MEGIELLVRDNESHKGDYGHLLLVCGSDNMPGAAVLAVGAALRSGCGLVSLHSSSRVCDIVAGRFPSAIFSSGFSFPDMDKFSAVVVGPGLGLSSGNIVSELIENCREKGKRMLLDADALTFLAMHPMELPLNSVLTPHDGELRRFGEWKNDKSEVAAALSRQYGCIVVSKGYHTRIFAPDGSVHINGTGNPGMAKGGCGDVLAGLVGGLMARGYDSLTAAVAGTWIHGFAGDCLTDERTAEAYDSLDLVYNLHKGFKALKLKS